MNRSARRSACAQARIDEINDQARAKAARRAPTSRHQPAELRIPAAIVPTRLEQAMPLEGPDPVGPKR